jgi:predicted MPP superfamily phosphohydrolase
MGIVHLKHWKLCLLLFVLLIYAFVLEPNILMVERLKLSDTPSLKIAFFADIHIWIQKPLHSLFLNESGRKGSISYSCGEMCFRLYTDMKYFAEFFTELASLAPIYAVYGNWEELETAVIDTYFQSGRCAGSSFTFDVVEISRQKDRKTGAPSHHYFSWTRFLL